MELLFFVVRPAYGQVPCVDDEAEKLEFIGDFANEFHGIDGLGTTNVFVRESEGHVCSKDAATDKLVNVASNHRAAGVIHEGRVDRGMLREGCRDRHGE